MATPHTRIADRAVRHLDVPLVPLKARMGRDFPPRISDSSLVARVRSEFLEMRGLSPTLTQAARLFHLPPDECRHVLAGLVNEGFLHEERDGRYRLSGRR